MSNVWNQITRRSAGKSDAKDTEALDKDNVKSVIDEYDRLFKEDSKSMGHNQDKIVERQDNYEKMVNSYYDLVTDFYEYGWGQSFHFAPRFSGEDFHASLARHEHYLPYRLQAKPGQIILDVGCGVGGPMRAIARFSGAKVVGVNNNDYQVRRANILNAKAGLSHLANAVKGDFMKLPFEANSFDGVYAIEATCHAPDKVGCYSQMFKVLKEGAYFSAYEWVMTDNYDPSNDEHRKIKHMVEHGDSLPDLPYGKDVVRALKEAGFEVLEAFDLYVEAQKNGSTIPWYETLLGSYSMSQFKHTKLGRTVTHSMVKMLETLRIAPKGTTQTHSMLCIGADGLARGGELGIFTPMFFFLARKPTSKK